MELPVFARPKVAITLAFILFLLTIVPALLSLLAIPILSPSISSFYTRISHINSTSTSSRTHIRDDEESCDLFNGEWVRNEEAPYYTNTTCREINDRQNCLKNGRPDIEFLKWRWKPGRCNLPVFDPKEFLELVRGKAMGFVGDSISRNQLESLLCLLSTVEYPQNISSSSDSDVKIWNFISYNFSIHSIWSPFLVNSTKTKYMEPGYKHFSLYLDEYDTTWTSQINQFSYLIISSGHWFYRPLIFYEDYSISGCTHCSLPNTTQLPMYYGYKKALRTSLRAILEHFKGLAFLRTFSPPHFEGKPWSEGGFCVKTRPYRRNETISERVDLKLHEIQLEEFRAAQEVKRNGLKLRLMDTTRSMLLRPDGHPGKYIHPQVIAKINDCLHWCLPGPIDTWNDILLQMMKTEMSKPSDAPAF